MTNFKLSLAALAALNVAMGAAAFSVDGFLGQADVIQPAQHRVLEFGDYAAYPDSCPLTTSCPVVCAANVTDCPTVCEDGKELCEWGNCLEDCSTELQVVENPCACEATPIACPKVVDDYDTCFERFQEYYDNDAACLEAAEEALPQVDFMKDPYCVASYCVIGIVTALVILWCLFNNVLAPVAGSSVDVTMANGQTWTMTGYKYHPVGLFVHVSVILTLLGIQFLLLVLTTLYYVQQEATEWEPVFYDEVQVLMAFEIVWMVGFVWSFAFQYPSSIRDLFLRRCSVSAASFVAVSAPTKSLDTPDNVSGMGDKLLKLIWFPFDMLLRVFFSMYNSKPGHDLIFCPVETDSVTGKRGFYHRMSRFVYDDKSHSYIPGTLSVGEKLGDFLEQSEGLTETEARSRFGLTGPNTISLKKPTMFGSIIKEFSKPFYLYQNFLVWTWAPYWYYYMAIVNTVVRVTGGVVVGIFQYMSDSNLYQLSHTEGETTVIRDGKTVSIANEKIVPGDVVVLKNGVISCDMAIIKSEHLVVDESAVTGEANPVAKACIDKSQANAPFDAFRHKNCVLSAGTQILETSETEGSELGLVLTTGAFTTKGKLVTEVLSYERHKFKFDDEVKVVLFLLIIEAAVLLGLVFHFIGDEQWVYAWFYGIFVVGTVIPPLLPTVFVVSVGISAKRLQANRVTCSYQQGILIAGKVDAAFFDKTGTLTKQGMDFISLDSANSELEEKSKLGVAVCNTLHKLADGTLIGNMVDVVAFQHVGAELEKTTGALSKIKCQGHSFNVLKRFEFDSHRQTTSVIVEDLSTGKKQIFVKGSPEAVARLCTNAVPESAKAALAKGSKEGMYQLAIAFKDYTFGDNISAVSRDDVEKSLQYGGLISFQNKLREESPAVITELLEGSVSVAMVTGDSIVTGIYIAKQAGIIAQDKTVLVGQKVDGAVQWTDSETESAVSPPTADSLKNGGTVLAISGEAWTGLRMNDPKFATTIANHVRVFGRCNPTDKVNVLSHFVEAGRKTLMVGDGQNDCGSLKTAHVGIALSAAEASIIAPFTSLDKSITSVVQVLREGRCALASAFAVYSYYIVYGQVESYLQTINAYLAITFTEWCWVFMDGIWSTLMAFSLPLAGAATKLSPTRPSASLLGPRTFISIAGMLVWNFVFIVIGLAVLHNEEWFECRKWDSVDVSNVLAIGDNYETTVLFVVGGFQYVISAVAVNFGYTWRQNYFKNFIFVLLSTTFVVFHYVITIHPSKFSCLWRINCDNENAVRWVTSSDPVAIANPWNTTVMPTEFRWKLVGIMTGNFLVLILWQYVFVNKFIASKFTEEDDAIPASTPSKQNAKQEQAAAPSAVESC